MSRELLGRIWMRPVRGMGWYCWGLPLPRRRQGPRAQPRQRSARGAGGPEGALAPPPRREVPPRPLASPLPLACFHMTFGGGYPSTEQFSTPALP